MHLLVSFCSVRLLFVDVVNSFGKKKTKHLPLSTIAAFNQLNYRKPLMIIRTYISIYILNSRRRCCRCFLLHCLCT